MEKMEFHSPPSADFEGKTPVETIAATTARLFLQENQQTQQMLIKRFAQRKNFSDIAAEHGLTAERIRQICDQFKRKLKPEIRDIKESLFQTIIDFQKENFVKLTPAWFETEWCPGEFLMGILTTLYPFMPVDPKFLNRKSSSSSIPLEHLSFQYSKLIELPTTNNLMIPLERMLALTVKNITLAEVIGFQIKSEIEKQLFSVTKLLLSGKFEAGKMDSETVALFSEKSLGEIAEILVRDTGRPMKTEEILEKAEPFLKAKKADKKYGMQDILENPVIVRLGDDLVGFKEHISFPTESWEQFRSFVEAYLGKGGKAVESGIIYRAAKSVFPDLSNKYELSHILMDTPGIINIGGSIFVHETAPEEVRHTIPEIVTVFLKGNGGVASRNTLLEQVLKYRTINEAGFTSNLKSINSLNFYGGSYYGLKEQDGENRATLSVTPDFICSYMLEKLHPKTGINDIIAGFAGFNTKKVVETIRADERFLVTRFPGSDEEVVICKNWQRNKIIVSIVRFNGGSIDHPSLCTWLVKLDQKYHDINVPNLMQLGIKFSRNIYTYQEVNNTK